MIVTVIITLSNCVVLWNMIILQMHPHFTQTGLHGMFFRTGTSLVATHFQHI